MIAELYVGAQIGILLGLGYLASRLKVVSDAFPGELSRFLISFCLPCVILKALLSESGDVGVHSVVWSCAVALIISLIALLLALVCSRLAGVKGDLSRVIIATTMFSNFTFMGFPIMEALYGVDGLFYVTLMSIPFRFLLYGGLPVLFSVKRDKPAGHWFGFLLSPPIIAVFAGLIMALLHVKLPPPVNSVVNGLSTASTSLGMILCGMLVARLPIKALFSDAQVLLATAMRLLIMPAFVLAAVYFLPVPRILLNVGVIFAALPTGSILSAYAAKSRLMPEKTASIIALSTIFSLVTVPFWAWILTLV